MPDFFHDIPLTADEAKILYLALRRYDGPSLCPDWPEKWQADLTAAMDRLRAGLYDENDSSFKG